MEITSRKNPLILRAASLKEKKYRDRERCFLLEGVKLFQEAVSASLTIEQVFALPEQTELCRKIAPHLEVITVSSSVLDKISTEKSPQGIICVAKVIDKYHNINKIYTMEDFRKDNRTVLLLSSLRDPGNLGTVIRSAAAFGCDEMILSSDCADLYHPRTVRAAMGTMFCQTINYVCDLAETVSLMKAAGFSVYAAMLDDKAARLDRLSLGGKIGFIVGNEGHGIDRRVASAAGEAVYIPMMNGVESLNAATAASLFLWQAMIARKGKELPS